LDSPACGGLTVLNSFPIETPAQIGYNGFKHYLLIYGSTEILDVRNPADVEKDFKDGIYHFNIGADAGLVKSINFTKTDVPGLKASRLTSQDEEEGQLRDKYNASLELIGSSPLFTPGQKIYVNPTLAGMGTITSRNSIARQLGLGGYYDVIKVLSTFDKSGYRTSLECVWTSFGKEVAEGAKQAVQPAVASTADPEPAATSIATPVTPSTPSTKSSPKRATPTPKPKADVATATERVRRGTTDRDRRTRDLAAAEAARQAAATQAAGDAEAAPQAEHYYTEAEARAAAAGEES
jgi:pyruvate/2-oxoglutarate dehydrogenase complex dihydrolipoamide acyltransferase (E2) component